MEGKTKTDQMIGRAKGAIVKRLYGITLLFFVGMNGLGIYHTANADDIGSNETGKSQDASISLVGLGEHGETIVKSVSATEYTQSISAIVDNVQTSVEPALFDSENSTASSRKWELRTLAIGCTITSQIGVGPIWSISPTARLRLVFSNSTSPVYPD